MSELAILGGEPTKTKPFPEWPIYDDRERRALNEVLESKVWWRTPGTKTKKFEEEFATYQQAEYGIACTNGTAALEIAIAALGIGLGDEVIVPDFTFVATASAVLSSGALPVFVDVNPLTYCIDVDKVESRITKRTKAIIAVHLAGHPADMDALKEIASKYQLKLIEDSAHAHGSEWKGHKVGSIGDVGTFSFQQSKLLTAGEGGMIVTNDSDLEIKLRSVHDCGRLPGEWFYSHFNYGSNYRLSEWQGAILSEQLRRFDDQIKTRSNNAELLDKLLLQIDGITPQAQDPRVTQNGHYCYIFSYNPIAFSGISTEKFIKSLNAEGIPTQASYPPVHSLALFQSDEYRKKLLPDHSAEDHAFLKEQYPETEQGFRNTIWLVHRTLLGDEEDVLEIGKAINKIQHHALELR